MRSVHPGGRPRSGMTLIEVMAALAMFAVVFGSIFGMARIMFRTALANLASGVSLHAAEGILEQMRVMPYSNTSSVRTSPSASNPIGTESSPPCDLNVGLLQLASVAPGAGYNKSYFVPVAFFIPDSTNGSVPTLKYQAIPPNQSTYVALSGVSVTGEYDSTTGKFTQIPLDIKVRILVTEKPTDSNFGAGVTIEVYYQYRVSGSDSYTQRVLRTFVGRSIS